MQQKSSSFKILILDDHLLFAEGISAQLGTLPDQIETVISTQASQYLRQLETANPFDLIITDLLMPDLNGMELMTSLRSKAITTPILVISATTEIKTISQVFEVGANGFVGKSAAPETMLKAVKEVLKGNNFLDPAIPKLEIIPAQSVASDPKLIPPRTSEVLQLMSKGHSNKEIGNIMEITEATVKWHVSRLFSIFDVKNRTSCVAKAARSGLLNENS